MKTHAIYIIIGLVLVGIVTGAILYTRAGKSKPAETTGYLR